MQGHESPAVHALDLLVIWYCNLVMISPQVVSKHPSLCALLISKHTISSICTWDHIDNVSCVYSVSINFSISSSVFWLRMHRQCRTIVLPSGLGSRWNECSSTSLLCLLLPPCCNSKHQEQRLELGLHLRGSVTLDFSGLCTQLRRNAAHTHPSELADMTVRAVSPDKYWAYYQ